MGFEEWTWNTLAVAGIWGQHWCAGGVHNLLSLHKCRWPQSFWFSLWSEVWSSLTPSASHSRCLHYKTSSTCQNPSCQMETSWTGHTFEHGNSRCHRCSLHPRPSCCSHPRLHRYSHQHATPELHRPCSTWIRSKHSPHVIDHFTIGRNVSLTRCTNTKRWFRCLQSLVGPKIHQSFEVLPHVARWFDVDSHAFIYGVGLQSAEKAFHLLCAMNK